MVRKLLYFNLINCFYLLAYIQQSKLPVNYLFVSGLLLTIWYNWQLAAGGALATKVALVLHYTLGLATLAFGGAILFYTFPRIIPTDKVIIAALNYYLFSGAAIALSGVLAVKRWTDFLLFIRL